jgi:hypothetical protein
MKPALLALCLLAPSLAGAACYTVTFEQPTPICCPQVGVKTSNGVTMTFAPGWRYSPDDDACSTPTGCLHETGDFGLTSWGGQANEPSGNTVATFQRGVTPETGLCFGSTHWIKFSAGVHFVSFWFSGQFDWDLCAPGCVFPGSVHSVDASASIYPGPPPEVGEYPPLALASLHISGSAPETGCIGDPTGYQCQWHYVELASGTAIDHLCFNAISNLEGQPFYIDDLRACTSDCPQPPCQFERATQDRETPAKRTSWGSLKAIYR